MKSFTIWVRYTVLCAATLVWDGMQLFISWVIQMIGVFAIIDALTYLGDASRLFPTDRVAAASLMYERMPLVLAVQAWGWCVFVLGKRLRAPGGWQTWTWKSILRSFITAGSIGELIQANELGRRLHLEALTHQQEGMSRLTAQRRADIARAAKTLEATRAYQAALNASRPGPPRRSYALSLAAVLLSAALSAAATASSTGRSADPRQSHATVKQACVTASVAGHITCHPPPSLHTASTVKNTHWEHSAMMPASPLLSRIVPEAWLTVRLRQIWLVYTRLPDPPWRAIDHVPILTRAT